MPLKHKEKFQLLIQGAAGRMADQQKDVAVRVLSDGDGGFAETLPNKITVLAESAERRSDIDVERAKAAADRARERLSKSKGDELDFIRARAALERALVRLRLAGGSSSN